MQRVLAAVEWTGWEGDPTAVAQWERFGQWLREEAAVAGGIGPNEADRVYSRHVADSLLFAGAWPPPHPPARLVDLGSGVGLPGIPLAILWPQTQVTLVDRSGRRVDLAKRAVRVLDLANVTVEQRDADRSGLQAEMVVARAAADPAVVRAWAGQIVTPGGCIVVAGSHGSEPDPAGPGEEIVIVPPEILDRSVWLRKMAPS